MNVGELAAFVCSHLKSRGIDVVLSGGSCVAIYASGKYVSMDLDFVERLPATRRQLKQALEEIGFAEERRYFVHPETEFFLEFPAGPLAVGERIRGTQHLIITYSFGYLSGQLRGLPSELADGGACPIQAVAVALCRYAVVAVR